MSTGLFAGILLLAISVCSGGELIEPTRTLQEAGKTWGGFAISRDPSQLEVYLNVEKVGLTSLWLREVETGTHTIKIAHAETSVRVEKELGRRAAAAYIGPSEDEKKSRDLTLWEKFVNGTLKHF